jgi:hypothetical protein
MHLWSMLALLGVAGPATWITLEQLASANSCTASKISAAAPAMALLTHVHGSPLPHTLDFVAS